jgi:hypothetical protein
MPTSCEHVLLRGAISCSLTSQAGEKGWRLSAQELDGLHSSPSLRKSLQDEKLQAILVEVKTVVSWDVVRCIVNGTRVCMLCSLIQIDTAKDREKELANALKKYPSLDRFLMDALRAVGAYEKRPDGTEFLRPIGCTAD